MGYRSIDDAVVYSFFILFTPESIGLTQKSPLFCPLPCQFRPPGYVVTNLKGDAQHLYDKVYCARGDMENRIKESQLDMFGGRTSCQHWWPNQFRLLLSSLAYTLIEAIRRLALKGTELARAYVGTIRLKLFKIGAVILLNSRRIRFLLASGCPYKELFFLVAHRLAPE